MILFCLFFLNTVSVQAFEPEENTASKEFLINVINAYQEQSETKLARYYSLENIEDSTVELRPRSLGRTDIIVDYHGERFVIETKIWRGNEYNSRGERQIIEYLDDYGLQTGYMLIFNFNRKKQVGIQEIKIGGKRIIEAVV